MKREVDGEPWAAPLWALQLRREAVKLCREQGHRIQLEEHWMKHWVTLLSIAKNRSGVHPARLERN